MEHFKVRSCRLCLIIVNENNERIVDVTKEMLDLVKLDFVVGSKCVICKVCSSKLDAALKFKSICRDTNETIFRYVDATTLPINLREIYVKERGSECISEDIKICHLCMQPIKNISEIKSINEELVDIIQKVVPEMELFIVKEPVMCKICLDSLEVHCNFLKKCSDVEQNIGNISNEEVSDMPSTVSSLDVRVKIEDIDEYEDIPQLIKIENVDIKVEEVQQYCDTKGVNMNYGGIKIESGNYGPEIPSEPPIFKNQVTQYYNCDVFNYKTNKLSFLNKQEFAKHDQHKKLHRYQCKNCSYVTKDLKHLKRHILIHKDPSEVQMYKCERCNYETKHKYNLKNHILIHKDPSEVQMYRCENCTFETKYKAALKSHTMFMHSNPSQVQMYKCEYCNYETKYKGHLKKHNLTHRDPLEVQMYKCEHCSYESKDKGNLKRHVLIHKDLSEVQIYKCENCNYETKDKRCLRRHILIHKDPSEVLMYKCENCSYETMHKEDLKHHKLIHKDPSEVKMHRCESCVFETKYRTVLKSHLLTHKDPSEVQMFKCEICSYETKYKGHLKKHTLTHKV